MLSKTYRVIEEGRVTYREENLHQQICLSLKDGQEVIHTDVDEARALLKDLTAVLKEIGEE